MDLKQQKKIYNHAKAEGISTMDEYDNFLAEHYSEEFIDGGIYETIKNWLKISRF